MTQDMQHHFSSTLEVTIYTRPVEHPEFDWVEVDRGPGYFHIPTDQEIGVHIRSINNATLAVLIKELSPVQEAITYMNLSENRNVTNPGIELLPQMTQLRTLNLSAVGVNSTGLEHLRKLMHLERLDLSYCNRLTDAALKTLEVMRTVHYVDLQGVPAITQAGLSRLHKRKDLTIIR